MLQTTHKKYAVVLLLTVVLCAYVLITPQSIGNIENSVQKGGFKVIGNKIYDPAGHLFIVKGITAVWGRFNGSAYGVGLTNYRNAQRDLDSIKGLGANFIRLFVSAYYANLPPTDSHYLPDYKQELDNVVNWATQRGMVIELANSLTDDFSTSLQFVGYLAVHYKDNPYVWIEPMNEPNCESGYHVRCSDWKFWQFQHIEYVRAIRQAGNTAPIIVNTIDHSSDLRQIGTYVLNDSNVVYGVHRYANESENFTLQEQKLSDEHWANFAAKFPVIVDEVGIYDGSGTYHPQWNQNFLQYLVNWVNARQGEGAVAYNWYTDEDNSMTGDWRHENSNGVFTVWGSMFNEWYLQKVVSR